MSLDDICTVNITANTSSPTRPGFGTPLIAAYFPTTIFANRVRTYSKPSDMIPDGFTVTHPAYLAAQAICSQNPKVKQFKVARRALPPTQTIHLQCLSATQGDKYTVQVGATSVSYTVGASATTTTVATAIAALIDPDPVAVATSATDTITITTPAAGTLVDVKNWSSNFVLSDVTADPGIATDLAAILLEDSNWYGLILDSNSKAEVLAAAAWAEASGLRLFVYNNSDKSCADPVSTTDVMATLKTSAYARTIGFYAGSQLLCYSAAAMMGHRFPDDPGGDTWAFKTLAGVPADTLTPTQYNAIESKNGNVYTTIAGLNVTQFGKSAAGEFADVTRFRDWLQANIQIAVFSLLANNKKIPFTDGGVDQIRSTIKGVLKQGVQAGGLAASPAPDVQAPLVSDVSTIDRAARNLPNVTFTGRLAGAVHTLTINGTLSV